MAIRTQAKEARALTRVAEEQTKAAENAAKSAQRQADLLADQTELSTAPLIVAELALGTAIPGHCNYALFNRGQGVAFQVSYWHGGLEKKDAIKTAIFAVQPSTLAPETSAPIAINNQWEVWTIRYKGIDRQERWTIVYKDTARGQEHVVQKGSQELYLA
jgi:hypothetical protein